MKIKRTRICPQVYVKGSIEAVEMYCKAFNAKIKVKYMSKENTYEHCELSVDGRMFLAVSEASAEFQRADGLTCYTMANNVWGLGSKEAVQKAYDVLSAGGKVIRPLDSLPWSAFCAELVDKFGVFWYISIG